MLLNGHDHHSMSRDRHVPFHVASTHAGIEPFLHAGDKAPFVFALLANSVRAEVEVCLLQFDGNRYDIEAFVLMPNHVHAVIKPTPGSDLSTVLQGIKGVSANRCNKLLGHKSTFWMDESYDHMVRDVKELRAFRNYIAQNPDKAGLRSEEYSLHLRDVLIT